MHYEFKRALLGLRGGADFGVGFALVFNSARVSKAGLEPAFSPQPDYGKDRSTSAKRSHVSSARRADVEP
jgi:hypothetical protein